MRRLRLLLAALACAAVLPADAGSLWEVTNQVEPYLQKRSLAMCRRSDVCGFVQANAWGVNAEQFCSCPGRQLCPMHWDSEDGRSVTHGSDQYKAPPLTECLPGELAMTDELVTYRDELVARRGDGVTSVVQERILCRCPAGHQLTRTDSDWRETANGDVYITKKTCIAMSRCAVGQHCKLVTLSPTSHLVQIACACAARQTCPSVTERDVETSEFGRGSLRAILCR